MFRSILIKQNLRNLNKQLNLRKCSSSNKLNDFIKENLVIKKKDQIKSTDHEEDEEWIKLNDNNRSNENHYNNQLNEIHHNNQLNEIHHNNQLNEFKKTNSIKIDPLLNSIDDCTDPLNLLKIIEPEINKLNINQLTKIYQKIIKLWFSSTKKEELNKSILMSMSFKLLIEQTEKLIDKLDADCLVKCFQTYSLINLNPLTRIVELILIRLNRRINELSIQETSDCLMAFNFYSNDQMNRKLLKFSNYSKLKDVFLQNSSNRILRYKFNFKELNLIFNLIKSYSKDNFNSSIVVINYLIETIYYLTNKNEFNSNQAIILLSLLKEMKFVNVLNNENQLDYIYYDLIKKCNLAISSQLKSTNDHNLFNYYLFKLHRNEDSQLFSLKSIYDPKILDSISNYLSINLDKQNSFLVFNLIYNYSRFDIYDEKLLKLIYDQILINPTLRTRFKNTFDVYFLFSKYRFQFIDYDQLATILFDLDSSKFHRMMNYIENNFKIFRDLILTDVHNKELYNKLIDHLNDQDNQFTQYGKIFNRTLQDTLLAKYYFKLFNKLDDENLSLQISKKLDYLIDDYFKLNDKPKIYDNYFQKSNKLQRGCFISNDLYLRNIIAIYDKSKKDLISLSNYVDYFNEIDKLPLNSDQQLIIFIESRNLKGNICNYERNYNYCLKKVLNHYGFKLIDVYPDQFSIGTTLNERVNFFIQKAKNNYK